ncbi:hypothetical protein HY604_00055 [Candidatus Peregrinibacteria bacterium]|nr:hypothetical protein [Candidatus Peregrinibacteria bacterium]
MSAEISTPWDGEERRSAGRIQGLYTREQQIGLTVKERFKERMPADLSYPETKFAEDGENGETVDTAGAALRVDITRFFDRLERRVNRAKYEFIRESFKVSVRTWEKAGLFTEARERRGYRKPNFRKDYKALFGADDTNKMCVSNKYFDGGYGRVVWAPEDVPIASRNPKTLTYFKLLEEALKKAYSGTAGGKAPNTLLVGPDKKVFTADQIDLEEIFFQVERYKKPGIIYNPKNLNSKKHGGQTEEEMLDALEGIERETGGVLRMERDRLIMLKDAKLPQMSGRDWYTAIKGVLPEGVRAQDAKQALAYIINCLEMEGWVPDYFDYENPENSRVALAPETCIPGRSRTGEVPAFYWHTNTPNPGLFYAGGNCADDLSIAIFGVRVGVRKNRV